MAATASGRIPDAFVRDLLSRVDIVEVIGSRVELKQAGREFRGLSPFTNEKSPSFFVNPSKQMFFDFSSGKNGTAISFLMENDRLSFVEAVEELAKSIGVEVPREGGQSSERLVLDGPLDALAAAQRFYREQLANSDIARSYLRRRGLTGATGNIYQIGFAPDSRTFITQKFSESSAKRQYAVEAGIIGQGEGGGFYDRFRNRIMFPIRDPRGRTIGFGGRTLGNDPAKYLNSPETLLFHKGRNLFGLYEAKQSSKADLPFLLVVEGYMDVVMLAHHGIRNAVATLGTATTRDHLALLFKNTKRVIFCFDGDRAGRSAASRALEQAIPEIYEGRECRFMFLPEGHDPDTLVQEIKAEGFLDLIEKAVPLSEFLLSELYKRVDTSSREGRARLVDVAIPYLDSMRDGILRDSLIATIAKRAGVNFDDVKYANRRIKPQLVRSRVEPPVGRDEVIRAFNASPIRRALQMLFERPALADKVRNVERLALYEHPRMALLIEAIDFFREEPGSTGAQFAEKIRGSDKESWLNGIDPIEISITDDGVEREFVDCLENINIKYFRQVAAKSLQRWSEGNASSEDAIAFKSILDEIHSPIFLKRIRVLQTMLASGEIGDDEVVELHELSERMRLIGRDV